jgi:hypothetical protein
MTTPTVEERLSIQPTRQEEEKRVKQMKEKVQKKLKAKRFPKRHLGGISDQSRMDLSGQRQVCRQTIMQCSLQNTTCNTS